MTFFGLRSLSVVACCSFLACSDDSDSKPPAPDASTLFDTLKPATPNKLRGVWGRTQQDPNGSIEIRLRFLDGYALGGARCVPNGATKSVLAGESVDLETSALDAQKGTFTLKQALNFSTTEGNVVCAAALASAATFDFQITESKLTLTVGNSGVTASFDKLGD